MLPTGDELVAEGDIVHSMPTPTDTSSEPSCAVSSATSPAMPLCCSVGTPRIVLM